MVDQVLQAKSFRPGFLPNVRAELRYDNHANAISPVDIPDALNQVSGSIGGPIIRDKTFFFATADYTHQNRTTFLASTLRPFRVAADGHLDVTGHYRQLLFDGRLDHKLTQSQTLIVSNDIDRFPMTTPRTPSEYERTKRRAQILAAVMDGSGSIHTWVFSRIL